jgi:hypothetical protein
VSRSLFMGRVVRWVRSSQPSRTVRLGRISWLSHPVTGAAGGTEWRPGRGPELEVWVLSACRSIRPRAQPRRAGAGRYGVGVVVRQNEVGAARHGTRSLGSYSPWTLRHPRHGHVTKSGDVQAPPAAVQAGRSSFRASVMLSMPLVLDLGWR